MKTLVTGGTGFIGNYLIRDLLNRGDSVRCLVRGFSDHLNDLGVEQHQGDITDPSSLKGIANGVDAVYHLAAAGHVGANTEEAYQHFRRLNVLSLDSLLNEVRESGSVQKFVHFSSTAAMGLIDGVADELTECRPVTPYQRSKKESEDLAFGYGSKYGIPMVVIRPSMVYGVGDRNDEFASMCRMVKRGMFPVPYGAKALTPMVYVSDVARAAVLAAEKGNPGQVYIITDNVSHMFAQIVRIIADELGVRRAGILIPRCIMNWGATASEMLSKVTGKPPVITRQRVKSIFADRVFNITKSRTELGFNPEVTVNEGISRTVAWLIKEGKC